MTAERMDSHSPHGSAVKLQQQADPESGRSWFVTIVNDSCGKPKPCRTMAAFQLVQTGMVHNGASVYTLHMFLNCPFRVKLIEFGDVFIMGLLFTTLCHVNSGRY